MVEMPQYKAIFDEVESTLIRIGNQDGRQEDIRRRLDEFKTLATKSFTDADYHRIMVHVVFYSGFKAVTVGKKLRAIDKYFSDYKSVALYSARDVDVMLANPAMLRNKSKIKACIDNAQAFESLVNQQGSFQTYLDSFSPRASLENLMRLRRDLRKRFGYLSKITSYHFLTDTGAPVLKPDRVIMRIFHRLGLIESENTSEDQLLKAVYEGHKFAQATGHPIRYVDIVFVAYGQVKLTGFSISQGICLKDTPNCAVCGVAKYCRYFAENSSTKAITK
jgi:DNA-3-methyladenine glycosylase I